MEVYLGLAAVATVALLSRGVWLPWVTSLLRMTASTPPAPAEELVAQPMGLHETFLLSLGVQEKYFVETGVAFKKFNDVCKSSEAARKQLALPLEGEAKS